ncbi:DUF6907 domain-containing protein, partial [Streptomyces scabiei]|uniref:DUF6907 domain-containing protein n=1 Tax=Streptomyces scabiei TaxID=1930 RepID=UPI000A8F63B4
VDPARVFRLLREHTPEPADAPAASLDKAIAALPAAVHAAMQQTVPGKYTPELADAIAAQAIANLTRRSSVAAAQRGDTWIARYGCAMPDCVLDHAGKDGEPGWHSTVPIETPTRDIDTDNLGNEDEPFLAAQITVTNYRPQAYGRRTAVWIHYGVHTGEVAPATARQIAREMRQFAGELEALSDRAEKIAVGDFEGDPEIARLDAEAEQLRIRRITEGRA